jgi:hypothetical protein
MTATLRAPRKTPVALEPLRVAMPLGIGDCCWVAMKLRALSKLHGGRPIEAHVNKSPDHASVGFLKLCPQIATAIEDDKALYHLHAELDEPYKSEKWSTLSGSAGWHGFDYILIANGHLESGKPLSSWLPELATEYSFELNIPETDREYARSLAPVGSVLLYPSGVGANRGFHRNTWTARHWAIVIRLLNAQGIVPVLVGAASADDKAYRDQVVRAARGAQFVDTIAQTNIPQVLAMIEDASVWCGLNSGLGIVSAMRQTPTLMLWADAAHPIHGSSTYTMPTAMQRSWLSPEQLTTYRTLSYGSPQLRPASVVETILAIQRR